MKNRGAGWKQGSRDGRRDTCTIGMSKSADWLVLTNACRRVSAYTTSVVLTLCANALRSAAFSCPRASGVKSAWPYFCDTYSSKACFVRQGQGAGRTNARMRIGWVSQTADTHVRRESGGGPGGGGHN